MKIDHVISSIDNSSGGPAQIITNLVLTLATTYPSVKIELHTASTSHPAFNEFLEPNAILSFYKLKYLGLFKDFKMNPSNTSSQIFHGHGLWELPVHQMIKRANKWNIPYVLSTHGMLNSWSLRQKSIKKKLALNLYQRRDIERASCLHATALEEAFDLRNLGFTNPIAVIPNGIPMNNFPPKDFGQIPIRRTVLFLSRIVKNKGVTELIEAWSRLPHDCTIGWNLDIVGNGHKAYINELKKLIKLKGQEQTIRIRGPIYGAEKINAFQQASLFVLPTYSENFGIAIAEALACGTPVITTKGAPWEDLITSGSGWWIDLGIEPLLDKLTIALSMRAEELTKMGLNGRKLIEQKYSMQVVTSQMKEMYDWLLGTRNKPNFIQQNDFKK